MSENDPFEGMSPAEIDELLRLEPAHDPEYQRERLREQLECIAWDAREGHLDTGEEFPIEEWHGFSPDLLDEDDFEWTFVYAEKNGTPVFEVIDPDGNDAGQMPATLEGEALLDAFGEFANAYHLAREIRKFHEHAHEPGETTLLPQGKIEILEDGMAAVYDPERELAEIVHPDDVTADLCKRVVDDWRATMREKYKGTSMEGEF